MNSAEIFIDDLITKVARQSRYHVGLGLLREVYGKYRAGVRTRNLPIDGFRPELIANNQKGQVYRHLQLHVGLHLLGGPFILLSQAANLIDLHQAGKGRPESETELLDNYAALLCANKVLSYYRAHLPYEELRRELKDILTIDN